MTLFHSLEQPVKVFAKESVLSGKSSNEGVYCEGWWHTIKVVPGKPLLCEVWFPKFGASYDKLTIGDIVWKVGDESDHYPLDFLQIWDCFSTESFVGEKTFFAECTVFITMKDASIVEGEYMWTVDWIGGLADVPEEHKSLNVGKLKNGQFFAQPNNRIRFVLPSLIYPDFLSERPDWVARVEIPSVEKEPKWKLGDRDSWTYDENKND